VVEVTSGRVEVRKKQAVEFLNAGAAWSSGESAPGALVGTEASTERGEAKVRELAKAASSQARRAANDPVEAPRGNLAQANALLTSALEASRKGNDTLALARLDELLRRYPDSPVADNARVERFRTLRRLGREQEASRAATKYLKGDPDGFARDEARELGK
jgi:predicted Zn-dependent protease